MRKALRTYALNTAVLYIICSLIKGVSYTGPRSLLVASLVLTLVNFLIRPLIDLLLLPVNILTMGALRWVASVVSLYLVSMLVSGFSISGFGFPGFSYYGFIIPEIYFNTLLTTILAAMMMSFLSSILFWLFH